MSSEFCVQILEEAGHADKPPDLADGLDDVKFVGKETTMGE